MNPTRFSLAAKGVYPPWRALPETGCLRAKIWLAWQLARFRSNAYEISGLRQSSGTFNAKLKRRNPDIIPAKHIPVVMNPCYSGACNTPDSKHPRTSVCQRPVSGIVAPRFTFRNLQSAICNDLEFVEKGADVYVNGVTRPLWICSENVKCIEDPIPNDVRPFAEAACGSHACHKNES